MNPEELIEEETETKLVPANVGADLVLMDVEQFVGYIERRSKLLEAAVPIALASTLKSDWCNLQGKPYPMDSAIEKFRVRFGISCTNPRFAREVSEDEKGSRYQWTCMMDFHLPGSSEVLTAIGVASNRKQFYAKAGDRWKKQYEIHEDNIKKHAWTNCMHNGITRILGLRGITWEEVEKFVQFKRKDVTAVDYDGGNKGAATATTSSRPASKAKAETKSKAKATPKADVAPDAVEVKSEWFLRANYLMSIGAEEEEIYSGYLPFKAPDKQGNKWAQPEQVEKFKTKKSIAWLKDAIKEIDENEDMSGYEDFLDEQPEEGVNRGG